MCNRLLKTTSSLSSNLISKDTSKNMFDFDISYAKSIKSIKIKQDKKRDMAVIGWQFRNLPVGLDTMVQTNLSFVRMAIC